MTLERRALLEALYKKYGRKQGWAQKCFYLRKKYFWLFFITGLNLLKRFMDIVIGGLALIFFLPLMILIAAVIKLTDGGPVFYISDRVGKWGEEFRFIKFRTMVSSADELKESLIHKNEIENDIKFKMKEDPRVTPFGRFLRKTSLDELPQLWNVLKGEMSLVGPRPPLSTEVVNYSIRERKRLDVKPGLTCIWQVSGRSELNFKQQVQLDLEYIESQSLWFDIILMIKTIPAVLFGRGAY